MSKLTIADIEKAMDEGATSLSEIEGKPTVHNLEDVLENEFYESSPGCILSRSQLFCSIKCDPADSKRIIALLEKEPELAVDAKELKLDLKMFIEHVESSVNHEHPLMKKAEYMKRHVNGEQK